MSHQERVLGPNGFEQFPKRLHDQAIKQGQIAEPADTGEPEVLIKPSAKAKVELALKLKDDAKKQAEQDKRIKDAQDLKAKEALDEAKAVIKEDRTKVRY